jgi:hypothetical protein
MDAEQRTEAFAAGGRNAPDPPVEAFDAEMWRIQFLAMRDWRDRLWDARDGYHRVYDEALDLLRGVLDDGPGSEAWARADEFRKARD